MLTSQILALLCGSLIGTGVCLLVYLARTRRKGKLSLRNYQRGYHAGYSTGIIHSQAK